MFNSYQSYTPQYQKAFSRTPQLSNIKPSVWSEKNIVIPGKGKANYDFNPYCRKILDMVAPDHHAKKIAVMKGSQITFSSGVIMPALGYTIKEDPKNTLLMVGATDLIKPASEKLDLMIHGAKLQDYLTHAVKRKRNTKTGDTDEIKSFLNGYIKIASNSNPKAIAQIDLARIYLDDFDAMKGQSKAAGSLLDLIEMRAASNYSDYKLMMISTPLEKATSNIEPAFLMGDQEWYFLNCPCCYEPIIIKWNVAEGETINSLTNEKAVGNGGIYYERDSLDRLITKSVGYVCYKCAGFFNDRNKQQMLREGDWHPTSTSVSDDYFSFKISSLYAPVGMFDWTYYAGKYIEANPQGQPRNEAKMQVIMNTCWAETYEQPPEDVSATQIMRNVRKYEVGMIPEAQSIADGNGQIVLLTCGSDMNGTVKGVNGAQEDDARLDYSVWAWSESGARYAITHGSVGTFIPREGSKKYKEDRKRWTYEHGKENSVWPEFDRITRQPFLTDTGRTMFINMPCLDCGAYSDKAEAFLDWSIGHYPDNPCVGVRGNKEEKYVQNNANLALFTVGKYRNDVYFLQVGILKDTVSMHMKLKWDEGNEDQPPYFMNFPQPSDGKYGFENFFEHYESEHRTKVSDKDGAISFRWVKKRSNVQNHLWDCDIYNLGAKEIITYKLGKELGEKEFRWVDYVNFVLDR